MVKDQILEILKNYGFRVKELSSHSYVFSYEGLHIQYIPDDDESFFRMTLPSLSEVSDDNRSLYLEVCNEANTTLKYVKVHILDGDLWATYECRCCEGTNYEDLVYHSIYILQATSFFIERLLSGKSAPFSPSNGDSDDSDSDDDVNDEIDDFNFSDFFAEDNDNDNNE